MRKPSDPLAGTRHGVYGPVQRGQARDDHRRRAEVARPEVDLRAGTCRQLAPAVAERYFGNPQSRAFERATARTICAACPVLAECLAEAIATYVPHDERAGVIRAGQSAWDLAALRAEVEREGTSTRKLAERVIRHMLPPLRGAYGSKHLRRGEFTSPTPLA